MDRIQFEQTVKKLEEDSRQNPEKYRRKVAGLIYLGYGYILFVLFVALALIGALAYIVIMRHTLNTGIIKIGICLLFFVVVIIKSLFVKFSKPEGMALKRSDFPELFKMIDELTERLNAPKFHHVLLDDQFNAAVYQHPRLGILGWQTNYLMLGLPLMQALSPEEFRAVAAHEFGHLSGNHGKFGGWVYRVFRTWDQIHQNMRGRNHSGNFILGKFLQWYYPTFSAYSFVLRRADEYVADKCSADLTSAQTAVRALATISIKDNFINEIFWSDIWKKAKETQQAPGATYRQMANALQQFTAGTGNHSAFATPDQQRVLKWFNATFRRKTDYSDSHPALADRARALGFEVRRPDPPTTELNDWLPGVREEKSPVTAANYYLGPREAELVAHFNAQWCKAVEKSWQGQFQLTRDAEKKRDELQQKSQQEVLSEEERWELAVAAHDAKGLQAAMPFVRELLAVAPDHPQGNFMYGQALLDANDDEGVEYLNKSANKDFRIASTVFQVLHQHMLENGREAEAEKYRQRLLLHSDDLQSAMQERSSVTAKDEFGEHSLTQEELSKLTEILTSLKNVGEAYMVTKKVQHLPDMPMNILLLKKSASTLKLAPEDSAFMKSCLVALGKWEDSPLAYILLFNTDGKVTKKIKEIPNSKVYVRQKK